MTTTVSTDIQNTRNARRIERDRQRRIAQDERAERKRSRKNGFTNVANPRKSTLLIHSFPTRRSSDLDRKSVV